MSRWHIVENDLYNQTYVIAHACPGAHSPYRETQTYAWFERQWGSDPDFNFHSPVGPKPTHRCGLCGIFGKADPHLPWREDFAGDLERSRFDQFWLNDQMNERWKRGY